MFSQIETAGQFSNNSTTFYKIYATHLWFNNNQKL